MASWESLLFFCLLFFLISFLHGLNKHIAGFRVGIRHGQAVSLFPLLSTTQQPAVPSYRTTILHIRHHFFFLSTARIHIDCWHNGSSQRPRGTTGTPRGYKVETFTSSLERQDCQCPILHTQPGCESQKEKKRKDNQYGSGIVHENKGIYQEKKTWEKILLNPYWPGLIRYIKQWELYCCSSSSSCVPLGESPPCVCVPACLRACVFPPQQAMESHNLVNTFWLYL